MNVLPEKQNCRLGRREILKQKFTLSGNRKILQRLSYNKKEELGEGGKKSPKPTKDSSCVKLTNLNPSEDSQLHFRPLRSQQLKLAVAS